MGDADRPSGRTVPGDPPADRSRATVEWSDLFRLRSPEDAERWVRDHVPPDAAGDGPDGPPARGIAAYRDALDAWTAARGELERTEDGLRSRTQEIGLIQSLGQRAAEATGVRDLFARAADVLESSGGLDVALALHRLGGKTEAEAFLGIPADTETLRTLARRAERFLEWPETADLAIAARRVGGFDDNRGTLRTVRERHSTFLPIRSRGRTVACLALVHPVAPDDSRQRVLWSAANQLSLHLDRILAVRESEQDRFRSILDSMSSAVVLTDLDLRVRHANRAALGLLERIEVAPDGGRLANGSGLDLESSARRVLGSGSAPVEDECRIRTGETLHVSLSAHRSIDGDSDGLVVVLTDVTETRRMQDQLAQAEKMSSLGQMISGVAHELNNPLASILGYAQLLRTTTHDDGLRSKLEVLDRESRRCQKIVQNLLKFARRHEPERGPLSLNEVVESVVGLVRYPLKVDTVRIETRLDPGLPAIAGDAHLLQQVLINLMTNAHHALRDAGRAGVVTVTTAVLPDDRVRLVVEDDGPGVPADIRSRVFDPFFTTKTTGHGTGLGLSLVYGSVASHGGTVALEDSAGGGARFVIELPSGVEDLIRSESAIRVARERAAIARAHILVVEDEEPIASLVRETFEGDGHRVTVARDGGEALARVTEGDYDAVLLDWRVPVLGGARLIEEVLRARPGLRDRIVMTTGDTVSREPDEVAARERLPVVHKPFDLDDLRRAIHDRIRSAPEP